MEPEDSSKNPTMAKLNLTGAYSGVLEIELEVWTVPMLREEVAKRSNCEPKSIGLICGGKVLIDGEGDAKLSELGIQINAKIFSIRVTEEEKEKLTAEEELATAVALAKKHADGSSSFKDKLHLHIHYGEKVQVETETDRRGIITGLMLHSRAKHLIKKQEYEDALAMLSMAEEAYSLCDPEVLQRVTNVSTLQIDIVWCNFMLRDIKWLLVTAVHLAKAREALGHTIEISTRESFYIAMYLRLEILEGVVAYHNYEFEISWKAMTLAQDKFLQLQVPDEPLSVLMNMGFKEHLAKRALVRTNQDTESACKFLVVEEERIARIVEERVQEENEIIERKLYSMTPLGKPVDLQRLNELVSVGFERGLAAEALRRNENDTQKALDDLKIPETVSMMKWKKERKIVDDVIRNAASWGSARAMGIMQAYGFSQQLALCLLTGEPMPVHSDSLNDEDVTEGPSDTNETEAASVNDQDVMEGPSDTNETEAASLNDEDVMEGPSDTNETEAASLNDEEVMEGPSDTNETEAASLNDEDVMEGPSDTNETEAASLNDEEVMEGPSDTNETEAASLNDEDVMEGPSDTNETEAASLNDEDVMEGPSDTNETEAASLNDEDVMEGPSDTAASLNDEDVMEGPSDTNETEAANDDDVMEGPSDINETEARDLEMENTLIDELISDPLLEYDFDIAKEGEAITEYLALLASTPNN